MANVSAEDKDGRYSFWSSLPGIITAIAGLITAIGSVYVIVKSNDHKPAEEKVETKISGKTGVDEQTANRGGTPDGQATIGKRPGIKIGPDGRPIETVLIKSTGTTKDHQLVTAGPLQSYCQIVGHISGQLKWPVATEPGGPARIHVVNTVILELPNGMTRKVNIDHYENYRFDNVLTRQTYKIYVIGCRTDPAIHQFTPRRANARYHQNFKVISGPIID